jgi:hypothetical protein
MMPTFMSDWSVQNVAAVTTIIVFVYGILHWFFWKVVRKQKPRNSDQSNQVAARGGQGGHAHIEYSTGEAIGGAGGHGGGKFGPGGDGGNATVIGGSGRAVGGRGGNVE